MNDALLVLNPRHIPECVEAILGLDIPTCWISYMREPEAAEEINRAVRETAYDRYLILSDDTLPTPEALALVRQVDAPVVTGYCNLDENSQAEIVNLTTNRLPAPPSRASSYQFLTRTQVETHPGATMSTTFAGLALTMARRDLLLEYPLRTEPSTGGQMDFDLSYRLQQDGVPMVAAVGAYVHHVKERWSTLDRAHGKRLLIGEREPCVTWTGVKTPV